MICWKTNWTYWFIYKICLRRRTNLYLFFVIFYRSICFCNSVDNLLFLGLVGGLAWGWYLWTRWYYYVSTLWKLLIKWTSRFKSSLRISIGNCHNRIPSLSFILALVSMLWRCSKSKITLHHLQTLERKNWAIWSQYFKIIWRDFDTWICCRNRIRYGWNWHWGSLYWLAYLAWIRTKRR